MPKARKQLVNRIENLTLGAFGSLQPSETLNHLVRYLSTWSGSECVSSPFFLSVMNGNRTKPLPQQAIHGKCTRRVWRVLRMLNVDTLNKDYTIRGQGVDSHLASKSSSAAPFWSTRRTNERADPEAREAGQHHRGRAHTLGPMGYARSPLLLIKKIVQSSKFVSCMTGLLPTIQWLISLERTPPPTRRLLNIERTQGWSMLAFYHLQHLSYLRTHDLIPTSVPLPTSRLLSGFSSAPGSSSGKPRSQQPVININDAAVSTWSSRLWAVYVVLQLAHLREDRTLLLKRQRALNRLNPGEKERAELASRWDAWYNELAANLSYLPMTIHWYVALTFSLCTLRSTSSFAHSKSNLGRSRRASLKTM